MTPGGDGPDSPPPRPVRTSAFGQHGALSPVDRLGVWLSTRSIRKSVGSLTGRRVGDFGCGYEARTVRPLVDEVDRLVLVDVAVAPEFASQPSVTVVEGPLPEAMRSIEGGSLDVALCISVLEHLDAPEVMLRELFRVLSPGGICIVNVPTWAGKRVLEFSAYRLGLSPRAEMDDHKMYYDPRDLWPMLVRAGFTPHSIRCRRHKFGLNTIAVCKKSGYDR